MATVYFSSCKFKAAYPETFHQLADYINKHFAMTITGCCRGNLELLTAEDTAVFICNTCAAFCDESSQAQQVVSIWELLANDEEFPFPDYQGEALALQDCWRAYDKRPVQDAVRQLLRKMNIRIVELPENYEKTRFCGISVLQPPPAYYGKFAPQRLVEAVPDYFFRPYTDEEKTTRMRAHCDAIATEKVACYCTACAVGLNRGGKKPVHVMELLFPTAQ